MAAKTIKAIIKVNSKKAAAPATINNLSLLPVLAFRLIIIVLIAIIGIISLSKTIIKAGITIMRSADKED